MPLVSIIVYVKNIATFLPRCLVSLLNQTLRNVEIIILEDGSTDDSAAICEDFRSKYGNIQVVQTDNVGMARAYDMGVSMACGHYIMFIKADDFIAPNACEILYNNAIKYDSDVVKCGFVQYSQSEGRSQVLKWEEWIFSEIPPQDIPFKLSKHKTLLAYFGAVWITLFKADFIKPMKFTEGCGSAYQEYAFMIRCLLCAERISVVNDKLYFWNIDPNDSLPLPTNPQLLKVIEPFEVIKKWMFEQGCFEEYISEFYKEFMIVTYGFYEYMSDDLKPEFFNRLQKFYSDVNMFVFPVVSAMFSRPQVRFLISIMKDN